MRTVFSCFIIGLLWLSPQAHAQETVEVVSFNIRYGTPGDGENKWKSRRDRVFSIFKRYKEGIIATQEALPLQIDQILEEVPQLDVVYRSRTEVDKEGESNAIFYNKKTWRVVSHETFWLSETPEKPASKSWGNTLPRISTQVVFQHRNSGKTVKILNTHLDRSSNNSRVRSVELILRTLMTETVATPTILLGDFNAPFDDDIILRVKEFFNDAYTGDELEGCTFHGWNGGSHCPRIDYVFYDNSQKLKLKNFKIDQWKSKQLYPSDHYPLVATFELN
ncbi:endonuclease/exonuclease/phosphatase family protein [Roseivirga sp. 4D4]|uniref:endonuclease/exonuclease/phosphatase family protein n=1 Tax=Roseivirga sp. 4D4 TaxID=1889784 RepID=UPI00147E1A7B|nr:endonuclease/exonuclease/phosphatase family protein [Roseivirga sp. 4D4]